jgi:hypothetical protein
MQMDIVKQWFGKKNSVQKWNVFEAKISAQAHGYSVWTNAN